jgi:hypothetical protein
MNLRGRVKLFGLILFAAVALACPPPASADKRVALVVGNSSYQHAPLLPNPANDAAAIAATLKGAGFDIVDTRSNLPSAEMRRALRDFADQARDADIAVVYYAGHGIEIDGTNYLIPTDATLERDTDVYDEAYSLDRILQAIEPARRLRLVIVDACRNNPFLDAMKRTVASRAVSRGLARVEPATSNTLVAFAAKAGLTAFDGSSQNSPYAAALVKYIAAPGLDLRRAFGFIRDDVLQATGNRQEPYVYGSLGGEDVALVPAAKPAASTPSITEQSEIRREYELAVQIGTKEALDAFLAQHLEGYFPNLARLQLAQIVAEEARLAATEKARLAERERTRLVAEGALSADQEKAAADAKAAEDARLAAERTKLAAQQRAAEAERIVCAEGSFLNDDNECVKRRGETPTTARNDRHHRDSRRERADRTPREPARRDGGAAAAGPQGADITFRDETGRLRRYRLPSDEQELSSRIQGLIGGWSVSGGR